jgi:integrase
MSHLIPSGLILEYLAAAGHGSDDTGALFRPVKNGRTGRLDKAIMSDGVYKLVRKHSGAVGKEVGVHALRATAATNALDHEADIAKVQERLGTRMFRQRGSTIIERASKKAGRSRSRTRGNRSAFRSRRRRHRRDAL